MLQILVVCGAGLGSSFACQMSVETVLKEINVQAKVDHSDIASAAGTNADIIISGQNFKEQFSRYDLSQDLIFLERLVDKEEIREKLTPVLQEKGEL
ncbi:PTS sugar transporter subunit IIB [Oceanobacillus jeddahense]|uniref:PTS sugar transporter subunit IIB n=1 Tax=Oceanobacillus jeddahense TaxID=1462527 RepID=A0ABY5JU84_9BACI|nr:PTS sugar transporter subunit IIB [Oceanobacillus jeddahense]UUI03840.1 PTS sugar transporter subunit IIB [Oceanobacillus jeddahense]